MGRDREAGYKVKVLPAHQFLVRHWISENSAQWVARPRNRYEIIV